MKIKVNILSLTIFVLFQVALMSVTSEKNNLLSQPKHKLHTNKKLSLKHENSTTAENKSISASNQKGNKNSVSIKQEEIIVKEPSTGLDRVESKGFFTKTSKKNKSLAGEALGGFVAGIILFICSIHLICWNERRAVKDTEHIDFIKQEKKCVVLENGKEVEKEDENKVVIISGVASVQQEAKLTGLPLDISTSKGKIVVIKTHFECFSERVEERHKEVGEDYEGNALIQKETVTSRTWRDTHYAEGSKFATQYHHGKVLISDKYAVNMETFNKEVNSHQTNLLADNSYIYRPSEKDIPIIEEYFRSESYDMSRPFKIILKDPWIFIMRKNISIDDFNPDTYKFDESDIRLSIKYFYLPNKETYLTAVGGLDSSQDGVRQIVPYKTNLYKAGCSYYCCCCTDSDEKYHINLLYQSKKSREEIVDELEQLNNNSTWCLRIVGFLMHFAGYYLILYPLILIMGMIPFLGAIGATLLVIFAFIFSLITFLLIIACAWICARPLYAFLLFGIIILLSFIGKTTKEHFSQNEDSNQSNRHLQGGFLSS